MVLMGTKGKAKLVATLEREVPGAKGAVDLVALVTTKIAMDLVVRKAAKGPVENLAARKEELMAVALVSAILETLAAQALATQATPRAVVALASATPVTLAATHLAAPTLATLDPMASALATPTLAIQAEVSLVPLTQTQTLEEEASLLATQACTYPGRPLPSGCLKATQAR